MSFITEVVRISNFRHKLNIKCVIKGTLNIQGISNAKNFISLLVTIAVSGCGLLESTNTNNNAEKTATIGQLETVIELPFRPGNVSVTKSGRVFATVHPFSGEQGIQLLEVTSPDSYRPWPSSKYQSPKGQYSENTIDTPLGITKDKQGGLWIADMGQNLGKTRICGFDIDSGELISKINLPYRSITILLVIYHKFEKNIFSIHLSDFNGGSDIYLTYCSSTRQYERITCLFRLGWKDNSRWTAM